MRTENGKLPLTAANGSGKRTFVFGNNAKISLGENSIKNIRPF
jgi:hypothetical protein